jgi:anti-anti-sigma factor
MLESHFRIEVSDVGARSLLKLVGELDLASAPVLEKELDRLDDSAQIIVDLRDLEFIDSTGLSVLVRANQRAADGGGEFGIISSGDGQVRRLLDLTGLQEHLRVAETLERLANGS